MRKKSDEIQTVFPFAFTARKPRRGWFFVCMRRKRCYGQVLTVRPDKSFKRRGPLGVVIDSRKSGTTWESVQYDRSGEYRFLENVPPGYESSQVTPAR